MKKYILSTVIAGLLAASSTCATEKTACCKMAKQTEVKAVMQKVANWQIEHLNDDIGRYHAADNRLDAWTFGALYVGMVKWAAMANDDTYYEFLKEIGDGLDWKINVNYHADGIIVGQMYLDLYKKYQDPNMLKGIQEKLELIKANPSTQPINLNHYKHTQRWTWCDALLWPHRPGPK